MTKRYDVMWRSVKVLAEPRAFSAREVARILKERKDTVRRALRMAETIEPEDWERWRPDPERPGHGPPGQGEASPGEGVVRSRKDIGFWRDFNTEAVLAEAQRLWQERRLANPPRMGKPIVSTMRMQDDARLRVHRVEDIRREIPEWDSLTKGEKVQALRRVRPSREIGKLRISLTTTTRETS